MTGDDQLAKAASQAMQDGDVAEPTTLAAIVRGLAHPLQALQGEDQARELFEAFDRDFGFIHFSFSALPNTAKAQIQPLDEQRYASLLRWLVRGLRTWRRTEDPRYEKLVAALIVAQMCDSHQGLWSLLPNDIGDNADLFDDLARLVGSFAVAFNARPGAKVPIWEGEAVEEFKRADAAGDWVSVIRGWQQFRHQLFFANTLQTQAVRMLYRFSFKHLVAGLANLRQTPVAMQLATVLTIEQRLRLAIASDNPYVQIAVMYRTLTDDRRPQRLTDTDCGLLTDLLLKVANDAPRWGEWMKIFASYPALNLPLGRALAKAPQAAIDGYVDSISLFPKPVGPDAGRQSVAGCLREFRATAAPEQRRALWTRAYERWFQWGFNRADPNQHLTAISWSDLDYAVVAYACECMDEPALNRAMNSIRVELQTLEHRWHASFVDILTCWNRLLSKFQPYAHATFIANTSEDWLPEIRTYFAFDPSANAYMNVMYRTM
ncbi:MAG: hypothetical protein KGK33_08790 [Hyphomicrobiales bacterium]|nr:hypothetical protein [Hyphomicrobiales bacterium]